MYDYATQSLQRQEISILQDILKTNNEIIDLNNSLLFRFDFVAFIICLILVISIVRRCFC